MPLTLQLLDYKLHFSYYSSIPTKYFAFFPPLAFDGKKSMSAIGKNRKEKIDHYTVVSRGKFLDLFIPKDGTGAQIAYELHEVLKKYLAKESLIYVGSDR